MSTIQKQKKNKKSNFKVYDSIQIKKDALFLEKSEKNQKIYVSYKNKKGIVIDIIYSKGDDITYIVEMISTKGNLFKINILEKYLEPYVELFQPEFSIEDKVSVRNDADFSEKSDKNKKSYETYKNREGTITQLKHKGLDNDNSTYVVEMTSSTQPDKKFTFEILGKYIQKII
jgi:hypothetical protein